ncbi:MAG: SpoIID/LytB domain-containing protein [Lachnospiraceae bacterium]|nr:SpoIID/LytB domain-containing protein [Lachnospiraceae bacterium]
MKNLQNKMLLEEESGKWEKENLYAAEKNDLYKAGDELNVRVLLKTSDYSDIFHKAVSVRSEDGLIVVYYDRGRMFLERISGKAMLHLETGPSVKKYFSGGDGRIRVFPGKEEGFLQVTTINREMGIPSYRGYLEIQRTDNSFVIINILGMEKYLYAVVPGEMPAEYPEEALKAQAVCARTYAYGRIQHPGYPQFGAQLDDSVNDQVYCNRKEQKKTTKAVNETGGMVLMKNDGSSPAETYYYSTSCGVGTDTGAWASDGKTAVSDRRGCMISRAAPAERDTVTAEFLKQKYPEDFETEEGWYRWTYFAREIEIDSLRERLRDLTEEDANLKFNEVRDISIEERAAGGAAIKLKLLTDQGEIYICGERKLRTVLCDGKTPAVRQDGKEVVCEQMIPSAFFLLVPEFENRAVKGYTLIGGGYGHGIGMSQNAAKHMALEGWTAEEILDFFYDNCKAVRLY